MALAAQDVLRGVDLTLPTMTEPDATRAEVEALAAEAPAQLEGRRPATLDLSGLARPRT